MAQAPAPHRLRTSSTSFWAVPTLMMRVTGTMHAKYCACTQAMEEAGGSIACITRSPHTQRCTPHALHMQPRKCARLRALQVTCEIAPGSSSGLYPAITVTANGVQSNSLPLQAGALYSMYRSTSEWRKPEPWLSRTCPPTQLTTKTIPTALWLSRTCCGVEGRPRCARIRAPRMHACMHGLVCDAPDAWRTSYTLNLAWATLQHVARVQIIMCSLTDGMLPMLTCLAVHAAGGCMQQAQTPCCTQAAC